MAVPLRIGLIGAGWIATDHVFVLRKLGHDVVATCDIDLERAQKLAPDGARAYTDWEKMLAGEELDAVWVATPPLLHRAPAVAAMERGLPVFLEKPIARTLDDARAIAETAERTGVVCAIGYQWHATEALEWLLEALGAQQVAYLWGVSTGPTAARPWFLDRAGGGGNLLERGSHQLDLQRAVAGEVASVQVAASAVHLAQSEVDEPGDIEDAATMTLRFESGAVGTVLLAWTAQGQPGAYSLDVLAPAATLRIKLDPAFTLSGQVGDEHVKRTMTVHPFERSVARFVEAVRAGDPGRVFCAPRDALGTLADGARVRALTSRRGPLRRARGGSRVTMAGTTGLDAFFVPAAHTLPSNAAYLAHLAAAADDPSLIRLASNENTEPPSPRVRAALADAFLDANLSPPPTPPLKLALAARHGVEPSQVLVTAGSTEVIDALFRTFLRAGSEAVIPVPPGLSTDVGSKPSRRASSRSRWSARPPASATTWTPLSPPSPPRRGSSSSAARTTRPGT